MHARDSRPGQCAVAGHDVVSVTRGAWGRPCTCAAFTTDMQCKRCVPGKPPPNGPRVSRAVLWVQRAVEGQVAVGAIAGGIRRPGLGTTGEQIGSTRPPLQRRRRGAHRVEVGCRALGGCFQTCPLQAERGRCWVPQYSDQHSKGARTTQAALDEHQTWGAAARMGASKLGRLGQMRSCWLDQRGAQTLRPAAVKQFKAHGWAQHAWRRWCQC